MSEMPLSVHDRARIEIGRPWLVDPGPDLALTLDLTLDLELPLAEQMSNTNLVEVAQEKDRGGAHFCKKGGKRWNGGFTGSHRGNPGTVRGMCEGELRSCV